MTSQQQVGRDGCGVGYQGGGNKERREQRAAERSKRYHSAPALKSVYTCAGAPSVPDAGTECI